MSFIKCFFINLRTTERKREGYLSMRAKPEIDNYYLPFFNDWNNKLFNPEEFFSCIVLANAIFQRKVEFIPFTQDFATCWTAL